MTHAKPGDPVWIDLFTSDIDRAIAFYGDLFGWTADRGGPEYGGYVTFRKDGRAVAGGMARTPDAPEGPDQWTIYLASPDARATTETAATHNGVVVVPAMEVGELGVMAVLGDPGGAGVGVWQTREFGGIETAALVEGGKWRDHEGAPSWFELHTRAYDVTLAFYREVFGWDDLFPIDGEGFRYSTLHSTSPMMGGVMDAAVLPEDAFTGWMVYFGAGDVDETVARVVELGGSVVAPPEDSPYGRMATVLDPTGARFSIGGDA